MFPVQYGTYIGVYEVNFFRNKKFALNSISKICHSYLMHKKSNSCTLKNIIFIYGTINSLKRSDFELFAFEFVE